MTTAEHAPEEPRRFSIEESPLVRALTRVHLAHRDHTPRVLPFVVIAWLPLFIGALLRVAVGQQPAPILFDLSVHVRLLIAVPLMIYAGRLLEVRCRAAVNQLYAGGFTERENLDRIIGRAIRLRDSRLVEVLLILLTLFGGQASLWGLSATTGLFAGVVDPGALSFAKIWYLTIALPIAQFVMLRWLWHWAIWSYVVVRVSRLPLATIATHPDRAAGIGFLALPISAFTGFLLAIAGTIASAWGTQILDGRATLQAFVPPFIAFVVVSTLLACGPLLLFMGMLYRARHREIESYNQLSLDYVRGFHRKWVESRPASESLLGTPDIQSINDLIGAYDSLVRLRVVPFGPREIIGIWIASVVPMLPLIATTMPLDKLLAHIARALLGGVPV